MEDERKDCKWNIEELTHLLNGSRVVTERKRKVWALIENDPIFRNKCIYFKTRNEQYEMALKMSLRIEQLIKIHGLNDAESTELRDMIQCAGGTALPTVLQNAMFKPNLKMLFSDEQYAYYEALIDSWQIIGCYAQTELGHGSNIRGIETTATYIRDTDEFDIHSPTLSSMKWWPGSMGQTANFAVVYARLIVDEKDHGIHNFMVQLRSTLDHTALSGITIGNIGPKLGFNNIDNGYCTFTHIKIPRNAMAMRFASLDKYGNYHRKMGKEILYFTMLEVRAHIVATCGKFLGKACTIATRYSLVRKQGFKRGSEGFEYKVLDYQTQQYRLLPLIAASYAMHFGGHELVQMRESLVKDLKSGNTSSLPMIHAASCGLKALCSTIASNGVEECRRACGGHGYLASSGFPDMYGYVVQFVTVEGENYMITQQTSKALLKMFKRFGDGSSTPPEIADILETPFLEATVDCDVNMLSPAVYVGAFRYRVRHLLRSFALSIEKQMNNGITFDEAIQEHLVESYHLSMAYSMHFLVRSFSRIIEDLSISAHNELKMLCDLFAFYHIQKDMTDFIECGYFRVEHIDVVRKEILKLLRNLRTHALPLVDAFDFSDHFLNSTLGGYDGEVYQALFESTVHESANSCGPEMMVNAFKRPMESFLLQQSKL